MDTAPTTEAVYQGVYAFYNNANAAEQEKASKWLEQLQNSVRQTYILIVVELVFVGTKLKIIIGV